jgi:hypothetical protein
MFQRGIIDYCPTCKRYHEKSNKPVWPLSNLWQCDKCKERKEMAQGVMKGWLNEKRIK